eukprot:UN10243
MIMTILSIVIPNTMKTLLPTNNTTTTLTNTTTTTTTTTTTPEFTSKVVSWIQQHPVDTSTDSFSVIILMVGIICASISVVLLIVCICCCKKM